jgi:hypothetical protein
MSVDLIHIFVKWLEGTLYLSSQNQIEQIKIHINNLADPKNLSVAIVVINHSWCPFVDLYSVRQKLKIMKIFFVRNCQNLRTKKTLYSTRFTRVLNRSKPNLHTTQFTRQHVFVT